MQKQIFFLLAILMTLTFFSCSKEQSDPVVDYYFTISPSENYQFVNLDFSYIRAIQEIPGEDDNAIRTVYIDNQELAFSASNPEVKRLGQSSIEPCNIKWFDLSIGNLRVQNAAQGEILHIDLSHLGSTKTGEAFTIKYEDQVSVTFELQLDDSIIENNNGELLFDPVYITKVEQN